MRRIRSLAKPRPSLKRARASLNDLSPQYHNMGDSEQLYGVKNVFNIVGKALDVQVGGRVA
jgi:hypothetical protein